MVVHCQWPNIHRYHIQILLMKKKFAMWRADLFFNWLMYAFYSMGIDQLIMLRRGPREFTSCDKPFFCKRGRSCWKSPAEAVKEHSNVAGERFDVTNQELDTAAGARLLPRSPPLLLLHVAVQRFSIGLSGYGPSFPVRGIDLDMSGRRTHNPSHSPMRKS